MSVILETSTLLVYLLNERSQGEDPCQAPAGPLLLFCYPGGPLPRTSPRLGPRCCLDVPIALSCCLGLWRCPEALTSALAADVQRSPTS